MQERLIFPPRMQRSVPGHLLLCFGNSLSLSVPWHRWGKRSSSQLPACQQLCPALRGLSGWCPHSPQKCRSSPLSGDGFSSAVCQHTSLKIQALCSHPASSLSASLWRSIRLVLLPSATCPQFPTCHHQLRSPHVLQRGQGCWCNGTGAIGKMGLGLLVQRDRSCWSRGTGAVTALGDAAPHQRASNYIPHRWDAKSTSSPPAHAGEKEMKCGGSFGCVLRTDPLSSGKRAGRAVWGLWGGTGRVGVSQWGAGQPGAEPGLLAPLQARLLGHGAGILLSLLDCYFLLIRLQMRCFG